MSNSNHPDSARAVIAFLIIGLMAGIFLVFYQNSDYIMNSNQFYYFMTLAVVGAGFMIGLLYLASKPVQKHKAVTHKTHKKKRSSR